MASAAVIILPVMRIERVVVGEQRLLPSSDRRNVVELSRVRELREFQRRFANYKAAINNKP